MSSYKITIYKVLSFLPCREWYLSGNTKVPRGHFFIIFYLFSIHPPPGLLPVLGPLERYMIPTLDAALLCSSRAGADLG